MCVCVQTGQNSDAVLKVDTASGVAKISVEDYMKAISVMKPTVADVLVDDVAMTTGKNRVKKAVARSTKWLDTCIKLSETNEDTLLLATVGGCKDPFMRRLSASEAATRDVAGKCK